MPYLQFGKAAVSLLLCAGGIPRSAVTYNIGVRPCYIAYDWHRVARAANASRGTEISAL